MKRWRDLKGWQRTLLGATIEVAVLLALYEGLAHWLAARNLVAVALSPGPHVPAWVLAAAGLFLLVRLMTVLCIPAIVARAIVLGALDWWMPLHADGH